LLRHSVPVAKPCSETTSKRHGAAYVRLMKQRLVYHSTLALYILHVYFAAAAYSVSSRIQRIMTHWDPAYDGNVPRWTVRCGFVHEGVQCSVVGVTAQKPDAPKAKRVKIFCPHHAREEGRTFHGRNKEDRQYVMCLSDADKKRAREDTIYVDRKKKKTRSPARLRKESVSMWLGSGGFEECNVYYTKLILGELRVPPLLLGGYDRARVYLFNSFSLADLQYVYKRRADGRMLYLVRGSSIIR